MMGKTCPKKVAPLPSLERGVTICEKFREAMTNCADSIEQNAENAGAQTQKENEAKSELSALIQGESSSPPPSRIIYALTAFSIILPSNAPCSLIRLLDRLQLLALADTKAIPYSL